MSEPTKIQYAEWLTDADTRAVLAALGDGARIVGGAVRNALMGEAVADIDIATIATPQEAQALLEAKGIKVVPTGIDHGTITAVMPTRAYEITTLRIDVSTNGRHADVAFTGDWIEDAKRRDFTVNALYADADGTVHDPLGGLDDLKERRIRFIGDAPARIAEDYLRVLRFFRFHARYGKGEPDADGLKACADARESLRQLSAERVRDELLKILATDNAVVAFRQLAATGILSVVLPEASRLDRFDNLTDIEVNQLFISDPLLRLASMLELDKDGIAAFASRLRLSNKERARITAMLTDQTKIVAYLSIKEVRKALYRIGVECFKDRVMLGWASDRKGHNTFQWRAMLAMADSWQKPEFPLTGQMIKTAGVPEGPEIGRVAREVEDWWIDADFTDDDFSIIERLKAVVQATVY
ncbi:MAG: CCA tRNA nucleotidyltransferase [Parvibaculum sp.]|nr:CCA tRNA nucleotidyltransferase [Parvibaculum sp.]